MTTYDNQCHRCQENSMTINKEIVGTVVYIELTCEACDFAQDQTLDCMGRALHKELV